MKEEQPTNPGVGSATQAVVQNPTTAPGTGHTPSSPSTGYNVHKELFQANEHNATLRARNTALEEKIVELGAEVQRADLQFGCISNQNKELISELHKAKAEAERECEALRGSNTEFLNQIDELEKKNKDLLCSLAESDGSVNQLRAVNDRNAERMYDAETKAEELEADNTRLRRALLEQANCFATTLKALLPQA